MFPSLKICNAPIERKSETKFLGIVIDDRLSWKPHAKQLSGKLARLIGVLARVQGNLTLPAMRTLYFSLAFSYIRYGMVFWGAVSKSEFEKIYLLQKKLIRIICKADFLAHTDPLFKKTNILKL